jgi:formylglycine-generating enzyme required for sulfatase activity
MEPVYYYQETAIQDSRNANGTACDNAVMDKSKNGYRLPTEVEREYTARGGDPGKADWMYLYAGSNNADDVAWYHGNSPFTIRDVGQKNPNRLGIFDLSGNVQEWGWDWMHYGSAVTPDTPVDGENYSSRFNQKPMAGGGVGSNITLSCVADRWGYATSYRDGYVGFRVVRN